MQHRYPLFVRNDLDGFFGLFIDNLVQLLLIVQLCGLCGIGLSNPLLVDWILPGAAISVLWGNLFYAWQARRLARREGRDDVTALPYGINTPSLIVFVMFVMIPVYNQALQQTGDVAASARKAWLVGLVACLGSGVIELVGSLVAERIRRHTPRAALLSTLAGIAITFIAMLFALQIFERPLVAMLPLAVILVTYFAGARFPWGLPGGLVAVLLGTGIAWGLAGLAAAWPSAPGWVTDGAMSPAALEQSLADGIHLHAPRFAGGELWSVLARPQEWVGYLSVIIPMGLFNVIGSLQNIESAEAGGDRYPTGPSLAVNGVGTIAAALFGSCFPTTIYIGHPGWKGLGARAGYSTLNGLIVTLICLTGTVGLIGRAIPVEAGIAIVLWIGIVITAQAFQATPRSQASAVAVGLFPAIAAWGATLISGGNGAFALAKGSRTLQDLLSSSDPQTLNGFFIHGLLAIERGYIVTCMVLAAVSACLIAPTRSTATTSIPCSPSRNRAPTTWRFAPTVSRSATACSRSAFSCSVDRQRGIPNDVVGQPGSMPTRKPGPETGSTSGNRVANADRRRQPGHLRLRWIPDCAAQVASQRPSENSLIAGPASGGAEPRSCRLTAWLSTWPDSDTSE